VKSIYQIFFGWLINLIGAMSSHATLINMETHMEIVKRKVSRYFYDIVTNSHTYDTMI